MIDLTDLSDERRRHPRHRVEWNVEVTAQEWSEVRTLTATSASTGGLFVRSERLADVGTEVGVVLHIPDGTVLNLTGVVVRVAPEVPGFGLRLEAQRPSDLALLSAMAAAFGEPQPSTGATPAGDLGAQPSADAAEDLTGRGVYVHHLRRGRKRKEAFGPGQTVAARERAEATTEGGGKTKKIEGEKQRTDRPARAKRKRGDADLEIVEAYRRVVPPPPPRRRRKPPPLPTSKTSKPKPEDP